MGRRLAATGGPVLRAALAALLLTLVAAGCGRTAKPAFNDTDVMFAQMGLAQIAEGDRVAQIAERRAGNPGLRAVATELRGQWRAESETLAGWLEDWERPRAADPSAGAHAGHGALHSLREEDFAGLGVLHGADLDRGVVALLLGNLHNAMETMRMESAGGSYPGAVDLAKRMTESRQRQIQRLLAMAAG